MLQKNGWVGFAQRYLNYCEETNSDHKIDIQIYTKLFQRDSKFGITASKQLSWCVEWPRSDIIKV